MMKNATRRLGECVPVVLCVLLICLLLFLLLGEDPSPEELQPARAPAEITTNDYFVFAQGCVPVPGDNGNSCPNPPQVDWHHYLDFLRDSLGMTQPQFNAWAALHIGFVRARNADPIPVAVTVAQLNADDHPIYLIGHSAGGAALINYLIALKQKPPPLFPPIRGVYVLDAPLVRENLVHIMTSTWAGFENEAELRGLGVWAKSRGIDFLVISYADDWAVNPLNPVTDIAYRRVRANSAFRVAPWELSLKHNYFILDYQGARTLLVELFRSRH